MSRERHLGHGGMAATEEMWLVRGIGGECGLLVGVCFWMLCRLHWAVSPVVLGLAHRVYDGLDMRLERDLERERGHFDFCGRVQTGSPHIDSINQTSAAPQKHFDKDRRKRRVCAHNKD